MNKNSILVGIALIAIVIAAYLLIVRPFNSGKHLRSVPDYNAQMKKEYPEQGDFRGLDEEGNAIFAEPEPGGQ